MKDAKRFESFYVFLYKNQMKIRWGCTSLSFSSGNGFATLHFVFILQYIMYRYDLPYNYIITYYNTYCIYMSAYCSRLTCTAWDLKAWNHGNAVFSATEAFNSFQVLLIMKYNEYVFLQMSNQGTQFLWVRALSGWPAWLLAPQTHLAAWAMRR